MTEPVPSFRRSLVKALALWLGRGLLATFLILLVLLFFVGMFTLDIEMMKAKANWRW